MEKLLTIVVPAYNAQNFLRKNLDSFCSAQILPDIEILIINDGSTDSTRYIAEEYANKYPNSFRVQNDLVCYFNVHEADETLDTKAFEVLVQTLIISQADIVYS